MRPAIATILALILVSPCIADDDIGIGLATADITPPVGYRMSGYFYERPSTGVKDPLLAKAVVLKQGEVEGAMVFCDLIGIERAAGLAIRAEIARRTGIPTSRLSLAATHSHTGPLYAGTMRDHFHAKALSTGGADPREPLDYEAFLVKTLADLVDRARAAVRPSTIRAGVSGLRSVAFNRRFEMKDGTHRFNPGLRNPEIKRVLGPTDPDVGVLTFTPRGEARPVGSLWVFALHLDTTGGTLYSGDFPAVVSEGLAQRFGGGYVSAFGAGTCGDINHLDVTAERTRTTREIGLLLATAVVQSMEVSAPIEPMLRIESSTTEVPAQRVDAAEVARSLPLMDRLGDPKLPFLEAVRAATVVDLSLTYKAGTVPIEVQAWRLGRDAALVFLPGEVFVEHGLAIKKASPFRATLVVELANADPAYIPTLKACREGSYEVVNSRIAPGGGEKMVATAVELLTRLRP